MITQKESLLNPDIELKISKIQGKGMFAKKPIKKGEIIYIWGGIFKTGKEIEGINENEKRAIQVDEDFYLVEDKKDQTEDLTYFINHSCDPNVWMKDGVTFIARRDINRGEELTADYSMFVSENYVSRWDCKCGSKFCRHKITGKDYLLPELQRRYKNHLSPPINEKIRKLS